MTKNKESGSKRRFTVTVKVGQKGSRFYIPIPERLMKAAKLKTGDNLDFKIVGKDALMARVPAGGTITLRRKS